MSTLTQSITKNALILFSFAVLSTGLVAMTHWLTKDKIQSEKERVLKRLIYSMIPEELVDNDVYHDCILIPEDEHIATVEAARIYRTRQQNKPSAAIILTTTPEGYSGNITVAVGILQSGNIGGIRVVEHKETPGLGDKIETNKSDWHKQFDDQSWQLPANQWKVKKDGGAFDALTGATVTPRAVIKAIQQSLVYWRKHHDTIFELAANCNEG